jgi:hypothetical protein
MFQQALLHEIEAPPRCAVPPPDHTALDPVSVARCQLVGDELSDRIYHIAASSGSPHASKHIEDRLVILVPI